MSKITKNKLALLALAGLVASGSAHAESMTVDTHGGLDVFALNGNRDYWFTIAGRLFLDQAFFDHDHDEFGPGSGFPSGAYVRNARVILKGGTGNKFYYKLKLDFLDRADVEGVALRDAYVGYLYCPNLQFAAGLITPPFGLESWMSQEHISFMEDSIATDAFRPNASMGLFAEWHGEMFTLAGAVYQPHGPGYFAPGDSVPVLISGGGDVPVFFSSTPASPGSAFPGSSDHAVAARLTFSPVHDDVTVYHAGVSARYEHLHQNANRFNFRSGLEVTARQTPRLFSFIPPNSAESDDVWGAELAGRWGPLLVQGEFMWANVEREDFFAPGDFRSPGGSEDYRGYYIAASYFLTGEVRQYDFDTGVFRAVKLPEHRCGLWKGAWEVAIRHSYVDLLDHQRLVTDSLGSSSFEDSSLSPTGFRVNDIIGGGHSTVIALNYYVNNNVKFRANYMRADLAGDNEVDALGLRAEVTWG